MQAVQFDYEREPKPRQVRLSGPSIVVGEPVRIGVSGVEIEAVIGGVDAGVLTVKVKRTQAKVESAKPTRAAERGPRTRKRAG